ncbi:MAG: DNA-deoxyinosine glycosylase [Lachnospiraceae bacterium]|nr:DNA-deoxyinosine glycosylase [Lachnospiraceae bacterium]
MGEYSHLSHGFLPVYDEESKILILGSFPSVKSREQGFYYGHPHNRFWKVVAALCEEPVPKTIEEKKTMLLKHHIAIWDVIDSCDIIGSSDSSIKNVVPADIAGLLQKTKIERIFANGKTTEKLYNKYVKEQTGKKITVLPSTSPANAVCSLDKLAEVWREEIGDVKCLKC